MDSESYQKKAVDAFRKFTRRQLMELDTCAHCALCTDTCPAYAESGVSNYAPGVRSAKTLNLHNRKYGFWTRLMGQKQIDPNEMDDLADSAFNCTLCGRCMETCPFGFQTHELWLRVREIIHDLNGTIKNVQMLEGMLGDTKNPYGLEEDMRLDWADYTDLEELPEKDNADIAYFVGCTTAFKGANHETAFSIASILNHLSEDWTLLGEDEWCCGSPLLLAGDEEGAKEFAEHNLNEMVDRGVRKVITGCSGCFRVFKWEYPKLLGRELPFEVVHSVEYLRDKLVLGELKLDKVEERVAYHDPCELSRLGGVIKAPREAIDIFVDNYVELPENGMDVRCCGGGGLLQAANNELRLKIIQYRLDQVKETGAEILTSGCPACKLAFTDGVRQFEYDIEIMDLMELAARQLGML